MGNSKDLVGGRTDEKHPAVSGCLQLVTYLLLGGGILLSGAIVIFILRQLFSEDRWRGEAIAWMIGNIFVGLILLAIPIVAITFIVRRVGKR